MPQPLTSMIMLHAGPTNSSAQASLRILVVEDREDVALGLGLLLEKLGHQVRVALHAKDALQKAGEMHPDVVFLDIGLPDQCGYDVCKEFRETDWGARAYIVALTGRNEPNDLIRAANSGFDRHVGKPMEFHTLQEILLAVQQRAELNGGQHPSGEDLRAVA